MEVFETELLALSNDPKHVQMFKMKFHRPAQGAGKRVSGIGARV